MLSDGTLSGVGVDCHVRQRTLHMQTDEVLQKTKKLRKPPTRAMKPDARPNNPRKRLSSGTPLATTMEATIGTSAGHAQESDTGFGKRTMCVLYGRSARAKYHTRPNASEPPRMRRRADFDVTGLTPNV
jgi:hypothetical protein